MVARPGRIIPPGFFFYAPLSAFARIFIRLRIFLIDVYPFAHIIRFIKQHEEARRADLLAEGTEMELNQTRIEDAIIAEVADKLIGDEHLYDRAKRAFDERVERLWKDVAEARIRSAIELAITDGFEREYCKVDAFGRKDGEPTTIRAELEKHIGGYWNTTVGRDGKPSSGYGDKLTRAEWMMTQLVASDFEGTMKQHVVNLGGSLKDKHRGELHETVNRLLSETFNVRSADDQAANRRDRSSIQPSEKPVA